jgi:hypothetical protein
MVSLRYGEISVREKRVTIVAVPTERFGTFMQRAKS